jgi:hypothetical protein
MYPKVNQYVAEVGQSGCLVLAISMAEVKF